MARIESVEVLQVDLAPKRARSDAIESVWKTLFFHVHANAVGATVSLAPAAIDTALWDLRCRHAGKPLRL